MSASSEQTDTQRPSRLARTLSVVERVGNRLPDPVSLFVILSVLLACLSAVLGRNPAVGAVAAFVSVGAGYDASIFVTATDVLLAGITNSAAAIVDPSIELTALSNYWFSIVSAILIALAAAVVVDRVVEPNAVRPDPADDAGATEQEGEEARAAEVTDAQVRGLRDAGASLLALLAFYAAIWLPAGSPLRDPEDGSLVPSPFLDGIAIVLLLTFLAVERR